MLCHQGVTVNKVLDPTPDCWAVRRTFFNVSTEKRGQEKHVSWNKWICQNSDYPWNRKTYPKIANSLKVPNIFNMTPLPGTGSSRKLLVNSFLCFSGPTRQCVYFSIHLKQLFSLFSLPGLLWVGNWEYANVNPPQTVT